MKYRSGSAGSHKRTKKMTNNMIFNHNAHAVNRFRAARRCLFNIPLSEKESMPETGGFHMDM